MFKHYIDQTMSYQKAIYQCFQGSPDAKGGIKRYIDSILSSPAISSKVINSLESIDQSQFQLLHVHQQTLLWQLTGECPAVFTLHNHSPYCPSGTRYLASSQQPCDRSLSIFGCTWGHLIDGCGSRKPQKILKNFFNTFRDKDIILKYQIPVIVISQYVQEKLISQGIPKTQIFLLHHGIPEPDIKCAPISPDIHQQLRILYVGRIVPYKGLDWLLKALAQVSPQIHLDIAGSGWAQADIELMAKQLGVDNRITWHGWCNQEQLNTLYEQCFSLIVPSLWHEPAGLVNLEAYARYRPVIASHSGGIPDYVIHNETGLLVQPNQVQPLAAAITNLADSFSTTAAMGIRGNELFQERFTLERHKKKLETIYEIAVENFSVRKSCIAS